MADRLPIYEIEPAIVAGLREAWRLIVSAPTGSGKSTQVPQMLLDRGLLGTGQVVILHCAQHAAGANHARPCRFLA
jgi:ATP-dependent helicase HrpB